MGANGTAEAAATPEVDGEIAEILKLVAGLDRLIATDGLVDLSTIVPEDVTYRVPLMTGETRDYVVPGDIPFLMTLGYLRARDRFGRAEAAVGAADETEDSQQPALAALEHSWSGLIGALVEILAIRQPGMTAADLADVPNGVTRNLVGALWLRLVGLRLKPFSQELAEEGEGPKAGEPASTPDGTEPASSS